MENNGEEGINVNLNINLINAHITKVVSHNFKNYIKYSNEHYVFYKSKLGENEECNVVLWFKVDKNLEKLLFQLLVQ